MYSPTQQHFNPEAHQHNHHHPQQQHEPHAFHPSTSTGSASGGGGIHPNHDPQQSNNGGSSHTTVGAVPVRNNTAATYNTSTSSYSFGAASLAMSPTSTTTGTRGIPFGEANSHNWFGTSMDSVGSSFGQSPPIFNGPGGGRNELIVSPSTSTSQLDGLTTGEEDETQQRNLQEIFEKRRRRRESHNAVERRRRDNINERIHELCMLLPEHLLETAPTSSNVMSVSTSQGGTNTRAINKGTILKLSVDHIKELQIEVTRYQEKIRELENNIEGLKSDSSSSSIIGGGGGYNTTTAPPPPGNEYMNNHRMHPNDHQHHPHPHHHPQQQPHPQHTSSSSLLAHHAQQHDSLTHEPIHLVDSSQRERMNSIQFQQQFGNLHITPGEMARQQ
ncbi:helix-loop-helix DNA-binding domain-containing protein [Phascolomyces articulosus]|uniref:Helix-loop-helix DNA-binding domain-containing protein n=1 Tax=Phascolomyces articulosus TaxID=60185 RepID=A0AAD5KKJ0_9FUNG|nr:helix-loop-helix DNA-binding domain-containing protein [Phascolomyces articulosus]